MALLEHHLVVKRSSLPGAGKGLFTTKFIPKGTRIVEYKGRIVPWKEVSHKDANRYVLYVNRSHVIDAEPYKKAMGRFANDARGLVRIKGITNNSVYVKDGSRVFITANKNISPGSEIFVDYGREYWQAIRYNNRLNGKSQ